MLSTIAVPSFSIRSASQSGTCPPCNGRSAKPERFIAIQILIVTVVAYGDSDLFCDCMDSTLSEPPLREYVSRRNRWQAERQILERQFIRIGNWRLTLGIAGALLAWLAFGPHLVTAWVLLVLLIAFVALVIWHQRVLRRRTL